jgi:uncharacterized protein YggU (UPF0235/DUF167 family)
MQQNFTQRLEMQIPKETAYTGLEIMQKGNSSLEEFLKNNFKFPSSNFNEIKGFIGKDKEMEKIIFDLPEILSKELRYTNLSIDFMKETDPSEKILEIVVYSDLESKILLQKEDLICDMLIDKYPKSKLEYIILVDPHEKQ